jgi:hypothetical protein
MNGLCQTPVYRLLGLSNEALQVLLVIDGATAPVVD